MGKKVPYTIAKEIKEMVFAEADNCNYLSKSRTENAQFLSQLVGNPNIGGRLSEFIPKSEIRTYIKDAILNRYAKDKIQEKKPSDLVPIISNTIGVGASAFVEADSVYQTKLFKADNKYIVVADGTVLKWETALRKALLYVASKPFAENATNEVVILLTLFARHQKVSPSESRYLAKALSLCAARIYIYGEV